MKVVALKPFRGQEGMVSVGQELDVAEARGRDLVKRRLVVADVGTSQPATRRARRSAEGGEVSPTAEDQNGSQTSEESQSSLSEEVQAPSTRQKRSTRSKGRRR